MLTCIGIAPSFGSTLKVLGAVLAIILNRQCRETPSKAFALTRPNKADSERSEAPCQPTCRLSVVFAEELKRDGCYNINCCLLSSVDDDIFAA